MTRAIGWAVSFLTLLGTGGYVITYLVRWEWHRAAIAATIFVATEVAVAAAFVIRSNRRLAERLRVDRQDPGGAAGAGGWTAPIGSAAGEVDPRVLGHVRAAPAPPVRIPWLVSDKVGVFIPILLGAGVLLSALAWLVQWIAQATSGEGQERALAADLTTVAYPRQPLVVPDDALVAAGGPGATGSVARLVQPVPR